MNAPQINDRVSYEDMANPLREGIVSGILKTRWGTEFRITWDDGRISFSDCRQHGWKQTQG